MWMTTGYYHRDYYAYDEIQYAKRAIDIHIDYFLLKPVHGNWQKESASRFKRQRQSNRCPPFLGRYEVKLEIAGKIIVQSFTNHADA